MDHNAKDMLAACAFIKDRLFFVTLRQKPVCTDRELFFSVDEELVYER